MQQFFYGQAQVGTLLLYVVLLADLFYLNDHLQPPRGLLFINLFYYRTPSLRMSFCFFLQRQFSLGLSSLVIPLSPLFIFPVFSFPIVSPSRNSFPTDISISYSFLDYFQESSLLLMPLSLFFLSHFCMSTWSFLLLYFFGFYLLLLL